MRIRSVQLTAICVLVLGGVAPDPARADTEATLAKVLTEVKRQIHQARAREAGWPRIRIDSVEIELSVLFSTSLDGKVDLWVAEAGGDYSQSAMSTIALEFEPKGPPNIRRVPGMPLAEAISAVKNVVRAAANKPPRLRLAKFSYSMDFSITTEGKTGINVSPIRVGSDIAQTNRHRLTLKMSTSDNPRPRGSSPH